VTTALGLVPALQAAFWSTVPVNLCEIPTVDEFEGEIGRSFKVIRRVSRDVKRAVEEGAFPVVLAGNCNATVGVVARLRPESDDLEVCGSTRTPT